ncbi:uncharacterized protein LOC117892496 [Drosophila subobscura]|uniref:uncharacterized protein LOC117892496 n=1 Tax=Drosophila subobscura TaxID=7241 RepID=UPI00155B23EA|nr:uncharacterized protein LOC117892496 [Drosophila subobscura]
MSDEMALRITSRQLTLACSPFLLAFVCNFQHLVRNLDTNRLKNIENSASNNRILSASFYFQHTEEEAPSAVENYEPGSVQVILDIQLPPPMPLPLPDVEAVPALNADGLAAEQRELQPIAAEQPAVAALQADERVENLQAVLATPVRRDGARPPEMIANRRRHGPRGWCFYNYELILRDWGYSVAQQMLIEAYAFSERSEAIEERIEVLPRYRARHARVQKRSAFRRFQEEVRTFGEQLAVAGQVVVAGGQRLVAGISAGVAGALRLAARLNRRYGVAAGQRSMAGLRSIGVQCSIGGQHTGSGQCGQRTAVVHFGASEPQAQAAEGTAADAVPAASPPAAAAEPPVAVVRPMPRKRTSRN